MQTRTLGSDLVVSALGLGAMGMSDLYGPCDPEEGVATIHAALDTGINLIDTGDFYGNGHNEMLIARALRGRRREQAVLSVKFGALRAPDGSWLGHDGRPEAVKSSLAYSLKRLEVDYVDVYRPARVDPNVPIEETVGAIAEMIDAGYVRYLGLSEVGADTICRAHAVHPVADVQLEYSLLSRGIEQHILPVTRELGIGVTAYGVLARGLISGHWTAARQLTEDDYRSTNPRFLPDNIVRNLALVKALQVVAREFDVTPAQIAIAWVMGRGDDIVPLIGARRPDRLTEALGAADLTLSNEDLARIEEAIPPGSAAGERDAPEYLPAMDSEQAPVVSGGAA
jgi:aryl-alcohol dehydrogenase-like predicted oxidoreductase